MLQQSSYIFRNIYQNQLIPQIFTRLKNIDHSKVPVLNEEDLNEHYVRGDGPGGQAVNKTANCVVLKHLPTGIIVKCHESRSLSQNKKIARSILISKLDNIINKEDSVENQIKRVESKKIKEKNRKRNKLNELKFEWKQRENVE